MESLPIKPAHARYHTIGPSQITGKLIKLTSSLHLKGKEIEFFSLYIHTHN